LAQNIKLDEHGNVLPNQYVLPARYEVVCEVDDYFCTLVTLGDRQALMILHNA
jgi:hypothetical protein